MQSPSTMRTIPALYTSGHHLTSTPWFVRAGMSWTTWGSLTPSASSSTVLPPAWSAHAFRAHRVYSLSPAGLVATTRTVWCLLPSNHAGPRSATMVFSAQQRMLCHSTACSAPIPTAIFPLRCQPPFSERPLAPVAWAWAWRTRCLPMIP